MKVTRKVLIPRSREGTRGGTLIINTYRAFTRCRALLSIFYIYKRYHSRRQNVPKALKIGKPTGPTTLICGTYVKQITEYANTEV